MKPLHAVSGVIDKGNIVVFDGSGSFILPSSCASLAAMRKAIAGVQGRIPLHAKSGVLFCGRGNLMTRRRRVSAGGLSEPGPPGRPLKEKELGRFGELGTLNPGRRTRGRRRLRQTCLHVERTMLTWETKWAREASAMPNLSGVTNFGDLDDGTARQIQRPRKSRIMC